MLLQHKQTCLETIITVYRGLFSSIIFYGVELQGGSLDACRVFFVQRRAIWIMIQLPLLDSCGGVFRKFWLLMLYSLYIFKVILATYSIIGDLQTVSSGHRLPNRHGGNHRTLRYRLTLSQTEMSSPGDWHFNKHPSEIKVS